MEVVEVCPKKRVRVPIPPRPTTCPGDVKCTRRYVQPTRVGSFAPERTYCPPAKPIDTNTTYHMSYLDVDKATARQARTQSFRPSHNVEKACGKISDETTNRLSYRPNYGIIKARAIVPCRRPMTAQGPMQFMTTARHDFVPKHVSKPEVVIPCGNIRTSMGPLDGRTTAGLSYKDPGPLEPTASFKPFIKYNPPSEGIAKDTTQKLSYQPFRVFKKELYPWAQKPIYRTPQATMDGETTYSKSYMEAEMPKKEKLFVPGQADIFPLGKEFAGKTVYRESFLPCNTERPVPVVPCGNISVSDQKMSGDTTNKLSYQPVWTQKRTPIVPCRRNMMGDGPMQCVTTSRHDYVPKLVPRPDVIIPCDNIRTSDEPIQAGTTAGLSYMNPGPIDPVQSFKPFFQYCRPATKIDGDTVNMLSYQPWTPGPKLDLPWARKQQYRPPKDRMAGDSVYHMSYPAPGFFVEDCVPDQKGDSTDKRVA